MRSLGLLVVASLALGCGAKTGVSHDGPSPAPATDAGRDAGMDAGGPPLPPPPPPPPPPPLDAGTPDAPPVECLTNAECDDGIFCNGAERCQDGLCASRRRRCDDGVDCTVDSCDEALGACVSTPDDDLCPISHACDLGVGCRARALAHSASMIYDVDLPSGRPRFLVRAAVSLTDIALHPDRTLYGVTSGALVTIDLGTGRTRSVVTDPTLELSSLDAAPDGRIYGAGVTTVLELDPGTGRTTTVARFPPGHSSSGDIAFVEDRMLVTTTTDFSRSNDYLAEVDLASGSVTILGRTSHRCIWGLAAFRTTLYGLTCTGLVLTIDPVTGSSRLLSSGTVQFWGGTAR